MDHEHDTLADLDTLDDHELAIAGDDLDEQDDDTDDDGHYAPRFAQDAVRDDDGAADDGEDLDGLDAPTGGKVTKWCVAMAERDEAGEWQTVGEPLPGAEFDSMALAADFAHIRNRRQFGPKFDWAANPSRAWVPVMVGQAGALRRE